MQYNNRRSFLKKTSGLLAGLGLGTEALTASSFSELQSAEQARLIEPSSVLPNNPLVLFDNFHVGNRRTYSWKAKFAAARAAGFDGFELVTVAPGSDAWNEVMDLMPAAGFDVWGMHWTTQAVIDNNAGRLDEDIAIIEELVAACAKTPIEYISLSLSGNAELRGPTIQESGSARAEDRHWERAYKIISAFDRACASHQIRGALYPHTHWICDTPQSQAKILEGAKATHIGPAFCSHHWYANRNSVELDEALALPMMKHLNYVVLTNGRFNGNNFPAVRFDQGEIDMAWLLAKIYTFGYTGPISTQGWGIGGDPFMTSKNFVDTIKALRERFKTQPQLWPLE
ncbi:MAG: TIM barrel protein [Saprospiraceae bacterium]|nr:sugar phosphate isomerase/epimerase [Lewinella sp.]